MKSFIIAIVGLGFAVASCVAVGQDAAKDNEKEAAPSELKDSRTKASYSIGLGIGRNLKGLGLDSSEVDLDLLNRGLKDALDGGKALLTDEQIQGIMKGFLQEAIARQADKTKKQGEAFLAANKAKPGVITLPSGLQYKVIKQGTGPMPKATDTIVAHYKGTLIDGTEFDSSYKGGKPLEIPVNRVIPGWTEALQKMKVGSTWQLFIPSDLAYGANPQPGGKIAPHSVLLFDIDLQAIK